MDITYSTTWRLFSFLFSSSLPLSSQPFSKDTLPDFPVRQYVLTVFLQHRLYCDMLLVYRQERISQ